MANNINNLIVRLSTGAINVQASIAHFEGLLKQYVEAETTTNQDIADAVSSVFDENKGKRIPVPAVVNMTLSRMGCSALDWSEKSKQVHEFLTNNPAYSVKKGKGGGCGRAADLAETSSASQ